MPTDQLIDWAARGCARFADEGDFAHAAHGIERHVLAGAMAQAVDGRVVVFRNRPLAVPDHLVAQRIDRQCIAADRRAEDHRELPLQIVHGVEGGIGIHPQAAGQRELGRQNRSSWQDRICALLGKPPRHAGAGLRRWRINDRRGKSVCAVGKVVPARQKNRWRTKRHRLAGCGARPAHDQASRAHLHRGADGSAVRQPGGCRQRGNGHQLCGKMIGHGMDSDARLALPGGLPQQLGRLLLPLRKQFQNVTHIAVWRRPGRRAVERLVGPLRVR